MKYILLLLTIISMSFAGIGKITAINGQAYAVRGFSKITLKEGSEIEKKDLIKTMRNTKLQIVFNDHTVISLGQKTDFKIDDYIFSKTKVKASFSVAKGIFKSITGRIGKIDHSKFKLKTKNATIGVRGTTFIGIIEDDKETIACTSGEIVVENTKGTVFVKKGEVTSIREAQPPIPAKIINKKFIKKVKDVQPEINSDNINLNNKILVNKINKKQKKEKVQRRLLKKQKREIRLKRKQRKQITRRMENIQHSIESNIPNSNSDTTANIENNINEHSGETLNQATETVTQQVSTVESQMDSDYGDFASGNIEQVQETVQDTTQDIRDDTNTIHQLNALKDKVGGVSNLHYEGRVEGSHILNDDNRISLDVDLGHGTLNGNIKFTKRYGGHLMHRDENWDTDVHGDFQGGNRFSMEAVSHRYSGNGHADLEGEHLETARGQMNLTKDNGMLPDSHANINFVSHGGALSRD